MTNTAQSFSYSDATSTDDAEGKCIVQPGKVETVPWAYTYNPMGTADVTVNTAYGSLLIKQG